MAKLTRMPTQPREKQVAGRLSAAQRVRYGQVRNWLRRRLKENKSMTAAERAQADAEWDAVVKSCDVVLAAQAIDVGAGVTTENVGHLSRYVSVGQWANLPV